MHETCPHCGRVIVADSSDLQRMMRAHIEREHNQSYRRMDSWNKCPNCGGKGKISGMICSRCNGSGIV